MKKIYIALAISCIALAILLGHVLGVLSIVPSNNVIDATEPNVYNVSISTNYGKLSINKIELISWQETDNTEYSDEKYGIYLLSNDSDVLYENTFNIKGASTVIYMPYDKEASRIYFKNRETNDLVYKEIVNYSLEKYPDANSNEINGIVKFFTIFLIVVIAGIVMKLGKKKHAK